MPSLNEFKLQIQYLITPEECSPQAKWIQDKLIPGLKRCIPSGGNSSGG